MKKNQIPFTLNLASQINCDSFNLPNFAKNSNYNPKMQTSNFEFGIISQSLDTREVYDSGLNNDGTTRWDYYYKIDD